MSNMDIYNAGRVVPPEAQKTIKGGRLNGFTDVNAMWRIKMLTEMFGPCGIGWKIETAEHWTEVSLSTNEVCVYVRIKLYIKYNGEWSEPIEGIGGSKSDQAFTKGIQTNDECYKMATTDAISVACKMLGIAADVYWAGDRTKYTNMEPKAPEQAPTRDVNNELITPVDIKVIKDLISAKGVAANSVLQRYHITSFEQMKFGDFRNACAILGKYEDKRR